MAKYRKKPVGIEAFEWTGGIDQVEDPEWIREAIEKDIVSFDTVVGVKVMCIATPEGRMSAKVGDYIIRGVKGEIYPCKPDIFAVTYEVEGEGDKPGVPVFAKRNGETTPPELAKNEFTFYWFDGVAHYEDWKKKGDLVVVTGKHADRVVGLVVVAMMIDMKHPLKSGTGFLERNHPTMIAVPETAGYDLDKCEGRWWGPVHVPSLSHDLIPTTAAVMDYKEWKKFYGEFESVKNDDNQTTTPPS